MISGSNTNNTYFSLLATQTHPVNSYIATQLSLTTMITPGKSFSPEKKTEEQENAELFQFDKTGNLSVRYLRESYNAAKARASELNTNAGLSGNLRSHCQQTIRVYSALATLLYSTISISKADDLERFVRKRSLQVPNSLFDIDEWKPVLQIARNVRMGESGKYMDELGAFKSFMKLRLERILVASRIVINEYKKMKSDTKKELEALKSHMEDFRYKVIPYLQQKLNKVQDDNYNLTRDNKVLNDAVAAKDVEIKELTRAKLAQEHEHAAHIERVKKESFEAIAFAKSKIETQQAAHRAEISSLNRQHEAKVADIRKSNDAQVLHNSVTSKEVIDRLTKEREWLQKTHATVLSNAEKIQQQFKEQCDSEVERLEKRYAEAMENANSRLASESSNTQQLLQSTAATYEAKISSANAAREYETSMLQVKLEALEKALHESQEKLDKSQKNAEELAIKVYSGEGELTASRTEIANVKENLENQKRSYETLKENNNLEFDRLRKQLDGLFDEKSEMSIAVGTITAERDAILASKGTWSKDMDRLEHKERTLRREYEEQTRVVGEMESEKCRLMSYYDEKCQECTAQKKEIDSLKHVIDGWRKKHQTQEDEHYQLMSDLEADKSRLMGYYDEKCLQSDGYKKQIKILEDNILRMRKEFKAKELETMQLMNDIEADKSRLMGYYDEKCLQIGTYKKQLASFEKEMSRLKSESVQSGEGDSSELQQELAAFKQQMKQQEMTPVKTFNVKKNATEVVGAVAYVIAEYTVNQCLKQVATVVKQDIPPIINDNPFETAQYEPRSLDDDLRKLKELEAIISKKNNSIHGLVVAAEANEAEIKVLKTKILNGEEEAAKVANESNNLKDKINELTKENYYANEEISKLTEELEARTAELADQKSSAAAAMVSTANVVSAADEERLQSANAEVKDLRAQVQSLEAAAHSSDLSAKVLSGELAEKNTLIDEMSSQHESAIKINKAELENKEVTIMQLRKLVSDLKGSKDELESQLSELKEDPTLTAKIEKLQAITRGFNARARVKRTRMHRDAKTSGVLVATKHTNQGDSGWYCAPDGSLYYFVLDAEEWILTCGPITREAFEDTVMNLKPKTVASPGYLKVSNFDLVTQTVDQPGELYMSTSNWKLYFAVSVDHLVTDNR